MKKKEIERLEKQLWMKDAYTILSKKYDCVLYEHFIKVIKNNIHYDYYPISQKINKRVNNTNNWRELSKERFIEIFNQ